MRRVRTAFRRARKQLSSAAPGPTAVVVTTRTTLSRPRLHRVHVQGHRPWPPPPRLRPKATRATPRPPPRTSAGPCRATPRRARGRRGASSFFFRARALRLRRARRALSPASLSKRRERLLRRGPGGDEKRRRTPSTVRISSNRAGRGRPPSARSASAARGSRIADRACDRAAADVAARGRALSCDARRVRACAAYTRGVTRGGSARGCRERAAGAV